MSRRDCFRSSALYVSRYCRWKTFSIDALSWLFPIRLMLHRMSARAERSASFTGGERIEFAKVDDNEPRLADLLDRWKAVGYPLSGLKCFRIETSSTGSVILIYARTWRIEHLSMADAVP